jgi:hypothetical protein
MIATNELIQVHQDLSIQDLFRAYKHSKKRSGGGTNTKYQRPFLANIISLFLTRKYIWGELPAETQFYWEVYNPGRKSTRGIPFKDQLFCHGIEKEYLDITQPDYKPNLLRDDHELNSKLDSFKTLVLERLYPLIDYDDNQNLITTNFSLRIPDPESKLMVDGKYIGISYFDIPYYALNPLIGSRYIDLCHTIILDHSFSKTKDNTPADVQPESALLECHTVENTLLQLALDVGDPNFLIGEPTYMK